MKTLTPGHLYELLNFERPDQPGQRLQFIEKQPDPAKGSGALVTVNDGTTNEEVLVVLIDRLKFLQNKFPCTENIIAIGYLQTALATLILRTESRQARGVEGKALP